jgi:16S rRNA (cytosine967-C5)-methyltransferase
MQYLWSHLEQIRQQYKGALPLHHFLKQYFKQHPKLGSRDRRGLSDAMYAWYRTGKALCENQTSQKTLHLAALYLCNLRPKAFHNFFPLEWNDWAEDVSERVGKLQRNGISCDLSSLFPDAPVLSSGMEEMDWKLSLLIQPRLFLRMRIPQTKTETKLANTGLHYEWLSETSLALPNGSDIETIFSAKEYVVQDASSQATGAYFKAKKGEHWWDCCSGAGGKSLMLADQQSGVNLLATDVRATILENLKARFRQYQIESPLTDVVDSSNAAAVAALLKERQFDGIICDVPCTGSGTWARTPEQAYFFDRDSLKLFSDRQKIILKNSAQYLKPNGRILYITCSVFRDENEAVVEAVADETKLQIREMKLINGLAQKADALFIAVLEK